MKIFDKKTWNDAVFQKYLRKVPNLKENSLLKNGVLFVDGVPKINLFKKGLIKVATGVKVVSAEFNTLAKSTIIFAALQLAMEAITWVFNKLSAAWTKFAGDDSLVNKFESTTQSIEDTNNSINKYIDHL